MVYLNIDKKVLEKYSKEAEERFIESCGDDGSLQFDNLKMQYDEGPYYDEEKNTIEFSGSIEIGNDEFAFYSDSIQLDFDIVIAIIEAYRKKLGKLKTVLEATK